MPSPAGPQARRAMFERKLDEAYQRLPDTTPLSKTEKQPDLLEKLTAVASQEGFEVERLLGTGGMGAVVAARDRALGRRVALKFLPATRSPRDIERLRQEAERASSLGHENIVQVYSWHSVGTLTFFSMELVEGKTLEEAVASHKRGLPLAEVLRIMLEASAGLAAAHAQGILHRDIKPQNILISTSGRVKLADFGLSATLDEMSDQGELRSAISGTIGFMAPEQARGEGESLASDTWSLSATLYYALTGQMPVVQSEDGKSLLDNNRDGKITPLYTARANLPQPVYKFVARGLSREKSRRFSDASAFRAELENVLLQLDERALAKPIFTRLFLALRHRLFLSGLVAGFLLGILLALAAYWYLELS